MVRLWVYLVFFFDFWIYDNRSKVVNKFYVFVCVCKVLEIFCIYVDGVLILVELLLL